MLHPKLQSQINEFVDKKDPQTITRLFQKISETYHRYEELLKEAHVLELSKGIKIEEDASA
jgi:hypothetical protein